MGETCGHLAPERLQTIRIENVVSYCIVCSIVLFLCYFFVCRMFTVVLEFNFLCAFLLISTAVGTDARATESMRHGLVK